MESLGRTGTVEGSIHFVLFLANLFILVPHELIHGLFFKLFCPKNPVKYGFKWKSLVAYATSPGSLYRRGQVLVISLDPFVLISLGLTICLACNWLNASSYIFLAALHAAACTGDFYYTYLLLVKYRKGSILVEDTEEGLRIYRT